MTKAKRNYIAERLSTFDPYSFEKSLDKLIEDFIALRNEFSEYQHLRFTVERELGYYDIPRIHS